MAIIEDGTGTKKAAKVDTSNRLEVSAVTTAVTLSQTLNDTAWNINTGDIALTDGTESACLYFKNTNATKNFILPTFAVGIGALSGTVSNPAVVTLVKNPTTGTIIDNTTDCDMIQNRNFGNSDTLQGLSYKGAQGYTLTDGSDIAQFYQNGNGRLFATIDFVIPPQKSCGINIQLNATGGGNIYIALIGYFEA